MKKQYKMDMQLLLIIIVGISTIGLSIVTYFKNKSKDKEINSKNIEFGQSQKLLKDRTNDIIELQKQLQIKSEEVINLQNNSLNFITGGDCFPEIIPLIDNESKQIKLLIANKGDYPIYDVSVTYIEPVYFSLWEKNQLPENESVIDKQMISFNFSTVNSHSVRVFTKFTFPENQNELFFGFNMICRNGAFLQQLIIKNNNEGNLKAESKLYKNNKLIKSS